jgi:hypothetical protein
MGKGGEQAAAADQRNLITNASILPQKWIITTRVHQTHDLLTKMVQAILYKDLKLSEKLPRWLPKLTDKEMKKERVRTCKALLLRFLDNLGQCSHCW